MKGLSKSRYGIVVLSRAFLRKKQWAERELDGLVQREMVAGKVILPVWHGVGQEDVAQYSPSLADKLAGSTAIGFDQLATALVRAMDKGAPSPSSDSGPIERRRPVTENDLSQLRDALVGPDPEARLSALDDIVALSNRVRVEEHQEVRAWIGYALRGSPEARIRAMRVLRTFLGVVDATARADLVAWAQGVARKQFDKATDSTIKAEALDLLGLVVTPEDLERLVEHVIESPDEVYAVSRPLYALDRLKEIAPVRRELYEVRSEVNDSRIRSRIDELLEHIRVQH